MTQQDKPDNMQELVTEIARALVDEPTAVIVEAVEREESTVLRLRVAPSDVGKVIGKQGRTARSLRVIIGAICETQGVQHCIDIVQAGRDSSQVNSK